MGKFLDDFRYGVRLLLRSPGVASTAVLALALGIGANTAIFSVVYNVLLKPLPVKQPAQLFTFTHYNEQRKTSGNRTAYPDFVEWRKQLRSVSEAAAITQAPMSLGHGNEPERVFAGKVTESFFPMLGIGPVLGRNFLREEDEPGEGTVAILSYELWQRRFGGDPNVPGSRILLDGDPFTVVGVLAPGFRWVGQKMDIFVPLAGNPVRGVRPLTFVTAYGRVRDGAAQEEVQAEFDVLTAAQRAREPQYKGMRLKPGEITEWIVPDVKTSLWVLLGAVGLVLLLACANVANLLLSQAAARKREIAVRAALGAGRGRLMAQMLAESAPLGLAGGVLGLLIAWVCVRMLPLLNADRVPRLAETTIDPLVLAFTAAVSVLTCLLFGSVPAVVLARADLHDSLKEGGRSSTSGVKGRRLRTVLVSAEVAIALVLAIGATLMIRTFSALSNVDPGFSPESVLAGTVELPRHKLKDQQQVFTFYDTVIRRVRSLPGVVHAGMTNSLPLGGNYFRGDWQIEGRAPVQGKPLILNQRTVDPEYFKALRIPLRRGRYIDERDRKGAPTVVMISETTARRLFPGEDPIGKRIGDPGAWNTVVGVTADIKHTDVSLEADTELMLPFHQFPAAVITLVVRVDPAMYPDPNRFAPLLRRAVAEVSPDQAVFQVASLEQVMANRLAPRRLSMAILIGFSLLALILSAMGIYGVLAFSVEQRTQEIGVRMALGARASDVVHMILREGALLAVVGVAVGIAAAIALTRMAKSILYGVTATDPVVFAGTAIALSVVAAIASYVPARRATRVDPVIALRYE